MSALIITVIAASCLLILLLGLFIWGIANGQMDDLNTPAKRILNEDLEEKKVAL